MAKKHKIKPLAHFPSAMAQDKLPLKMPKRLGVLRWLLKSLIVLMLVAGFTIASVLLYLSRGPVSNERLRLEIATALSDMLGEVYSTKVSDARISFGNGGLLSIAVGKIALAEKSGGSPLAKVGQIHFGLKLLPLVGGRLKVDNILVEDAAIDVNRLRFKGKPIAWPNALNLDRVMRVPAERLAFISRSMNKSGLKKVVWRNLRVSGLNPPGGLRNDFVVQEIIFKNAGAAGNLSILAKATIGSRRVRLVGAWIVTDTGNAIELSVNGLDASDILPSAAGARKGALGIDAPIVLSYYHPFDRDLNPLQSTIQVKLSRGLMRFGRDKPEKFSGGQINLRLFPGKNQIELEKSPMRFTASSGVFTGGIRFPLPLEDATEKFRRGNSNGFDGNKDAANLTQPIFELIANDIIASPAGSSGRPVSASLRVAGKLLPADKILELDEINLWSGGGNLHGAGSLGFSGETPSLALALTIPRMQVSTISQLWPVFIASKARRWVRSHISGGIVTNARIDAAIPSGILGRMHRGKKLTAEQLSIHLNVVDSDVETVGDLPVISQVRGKVHYRGMITSVGLTAGIVQMANGRSVELSNGTMEIGDYQIKPTMAALKLDIKGNASDILWIGGRKPLPVVDVLKISPSEISGKAQVKLQTSFPLEKRISRSPIDWSADIKLTGGALSKPLNGYKLSKADVLIKARPGVAVISGKVHLNDIPATVSLVETYGAKARTAAKRSAKLQLDSRARKKLGLNLDDILSGPIGVTIDDDKNSKLKHVSADLTKATINFPWINWNKGKGIRASVTFDLKRQNQRNNIQNFKLKGAGFFAGGNLLLDKKGLVSARISRFALNQGDDLQVNVKRRGAGYRVKVQGKSYDARAVVRQILNKGTPKSRLTRGRPIEFTASIEKVAGFGGEILSDVALQYSQKDGQLNKVLLQGRSTRNSKTAISIVPLKGVTTTTLVSSNAGAMLRFLNLYKQMRGGALSATLNQKGNGPHKGKVLLENFHLINEPRLKSLLSADMELSSRDGREQPAKRTKPKTNPDDLKVKYTSIDIVKGDDSLVIKNGIMRAGDIGSNFSGTVYNKAGNMNLKGTFLPGYGLNKIASKIPIVGLAFGNGTQSGFLGITYRLKGKSKNPKISVNPLSLIAPGVFRRIFEFR